MDDNQLEAYNFEYNDEFLAEEGVEDNGNDDADEDVDEDDSEAPQNMMAAAAEYFISQRRLESTKSTYKSKVSGVKAFLIREGMYSALEVNHDNIQIKYPLAEDAIKRIFSWLTTDTSLARKKKGFVPSNQPDAGEEVGGDLFSITKETMSVSALRGYKSALKGDCERAKKKWTHEMNEVTESLIKGYNKVIQRKKKSGTMSSQEGRAPFSYAGYRFLALLLMTLSPMGGQYTFAMGIFAWAFEVWSWCLMQRSCSISAVKLSHISRKEDALVVDFSRTKSDQTGDALGKDKHIYANPNQPHICPFVTLGVNMICIRRDPNIRPELQPLFTGNEGRFGDVLSKVLYDNNLVPENSELHVLKHDLGTHSNRKGITSYLCSLASSLSVIAIYLRAGWSVGKLQDRYIFAGAGGDTIVARACSGNDVNDASFATLPCHFTLRGTEIIGEITYEFIFEDLRLYPASFHGALEFMAAALVFHHDYLRGTLSPDHPLWKQRMFTQEVTVQGETFLNAYEALKGHVVTGISNCPETGMQATGIPSHLLVSSEVRDLKSTVTQLKGQVTHLKGQVQQMAGEIARIPELLGQQQVQYTNYVRDELSEVPKRVADHIVEEFNVEGVQPLRPSDVKDMLQDGLKTQKEFFLERLDLLSESMTASLTHLVQQALSAPPPSEAESSQQNPAASSREATAPSSSSMDQPTCSQEAGLPPDFTFPRCDVKTMWNLWYFGNSSYNNTGTRVGPYRLLQARQLKTPREKERLSRARKVMAVLERLVVLTLRQDGLMMAEEQFTPLNGDDLSSDISSRSALESDGIFQKIISQFLEFVYAPPSSDSSGQQLRPKKKAKRPNEVMVCTLANRCSVDKADAFFSQQQQRLQQQQQQVETGGQTSSSAPFHYAF